jgi:hypothetical protein
MIVADSFWSTNGTLWHEWLLFTKRNEIPRRVTGRPLGVGRSLTQIKRDAASRLGGYADKIRWPPGWVDLGLPQGGEQHCGERPHMDLRGGPYRSRDSEA